MIPDNDNMNDHCNVCAYILEYSYIAARIATPSQFCLPYQLGGVDSDLCTGICTCGTVDQIRVL